MVQFIYLKACFEYSVLEMRLWTYLWTYLRNFSYTLQGGRQELSGFRVYEDWASDSQVHLYYNEQVARKIIFGKPFAWPTRRVRLTGTTLRCYFSE